MITRNGKVANLPNDIREQLNLRLLEGEPGRELAAWLNALPAVQSVLGSHFNGAPISEVNLTFWRQGGYLQWLTERECFGSARALADGDGNLATTGLSAGRLLNILTLRYGELLMRWDLSPDEGVSESAAFLTMAKKARILQGISRSVLAIHRIQSQSPREKSEPSRSSVTSHSRPEQDSQASPTTPQRRTEASEAGILGKTLLPLQRLPRERKVGNSNETNERGNQPIGTLLQTEVKSAIRNPKPEIPPILSGMITPASISWNLAHTSFKTHPDFSAFLEAV